MRKLTFIALLAALLLLLPACTEAAEPSQQPSEDIPSQSLEPSAPPVPQTAAARPATTDELYSKWMGLGVVTADRRGMTVSNAELCVIINNIMDYELDGTRRYDDLLRQDSYYYDVMAVDAAGVLTGSDGYFYPDEPMSRERAITALARAFALEQTGEEATSYSDDGLISDWARSACLACDRLGWYSGSSLRPQDNITQGELLWMLDKIINSMVSGGELSGTYYSGIVITGGQVNISDATIYGSLYIRRGTEQVTITNSAITGGIFMGPGGDGQAQGETMLSLSGSRVEGIVCNISSQVSAGGYVGQMYVNQPISLDLADGSQVSFFVTNSPITVTGGGVISMAIINDGAVGSSFASAPRVYFDSPGSYYSGPETGFLVILGKTYLVGDGGELYKGFVMVDDQEYYFDDNGVMATGQVEIDGVGYLFDDNGILISGFKHTDNGVCYVDLTGAMLTGRNTIGDYEYIFNSNGILQTGLFTYEDQAYIADENGILYIDSLAELNGDTYYAGETGHLLTGVVRIDDDGYYFDEQSYAMVKNTQIDDMVIDENGVIVNFDGGRLSSGDEELDAMLDEIIAQVCTEDMSLDEMMFAVYAWTKVNIRYRTTPIDLSRGYTEELVIEHGLNTMNTRRGACEHFAIVNALLFNRLGVETVLIQGYRLSLNNGDWSDHSWVLAKTEEGLFYHYDALFEYTNTGVERSAYMKTDSEMASHHVWEEEDYPLCDGQTAYDEDNQPIAQTEDATD